MSPSPGLAPTGPAPFPRGAGFTLHLDPSALRPLAPASRPQPPRPASSLREAILRWLEQEL